MSVLMTMRVHGDPKSVEHEDKALMKSIAERGKEHGVISHHFYGSDDEVLVIDEWPDEESFQRFFEATPEIQGIVQRAGATAAPDVMFWHHLETGDDIG